MNLKYNLKKHKILIESVLSLSILKGLNMLLPLITLPFILRVVGAANYGNYSYIYVIIQYLLLFTSYGFDYSATKQISQNRDNFKVINNIYNTILVCRFILFIIGLGIFILLFPLLIRTESEKFMFLLGLGIVVGDILNPTWFFQGMEKMKFMTVANMVAKFVFTILIFIFIREQGDYVYIILFNSLGFILAGITSMVIARKQFKIYFYFPSWKSIKYQFNEGFQLFSSSIGINLYSNANIFILKFFVDDTVLGVYSAAEKIIKGLKTLGSPISQALFPHLGYRFRNQPHETSLIQLNNAAKPFAFLLTVLSVATFLFSKQILHFFGGEEYVGGIILIRIMSPTIILGGLNALLGFSGLVNLNRSKDFLKAVFISGISSIIFLIIFVPLYGANVAAWVSVYSEIVLLSVILTSLYKLKKRIKNPI